METQSLSFWESKSKPEQWNESNMTVVNRIRKLLNKMFCSFTCMHWMQTNFMPLLINSLNIISLDNEACCK